jgi:hypothetical protein
MCEILSQIGVEMSNIFDLDERASGPATLSFNRDGVILFIVHESCVIHLIRILHRF